MYKEKIFLALRFPAVLQEEVFNNACEVEFIILKTALDHAKPLSSQKKQRLGGGNVIHHYGEPGFNPNSLIFHA
jgi:hypothetical protein